MNHMSSNPFELPNLLGVRIERLFEFGPMLSIYVGFSDNIVFRRIQIVCGLAKTSLRPRSLFPWHGHPLHWSLATSNDR